MLLISALLTKLSHCVMGKDNSFFIFILITFLIFHFPLCCFNKFIKRPLKTFFVVPCSHFWYNEIIWIFYQCICANADPDTKEHKFHELKSSLVFSKASLQEKIKGRGI